jgi:hypothetical protein
MIAKYFEKYGSNWGQMATHFQDRTAIMLKNRYYSFIRKRDLLSELLQEVKEIEKDDFAVDDMRDQDSERYTEIPRGDAKAGNTTNMCEEARDSSKNVSQDGVSQTMQDRHPIFGYENRQFTSHPALSQEEERQLRAINLLGGPKIEYQPNDQNREIEMLKMKVKSLQTLYLRAKMELDEIKAKGNN